jgi:hypothetical protein
MKLLTIAEINKNTIPTKTDRKKNFTNEAVLYALVTRKC